MKNHPTHYKGNIRPLDKQVTINGRNNPYDLDRDFVFIECNCGNDKFCIFVSGYPEVKCQCSTCGKEYLIYDVSFYPAASAYEPNKGKFKKWSNNLGKETFEVIASWVYPEEPENDNDLDWFVLIARDAESNEYFEVINDETA